MTAASSAALASAGIPTSPGLSTPAATTRLLGNLGLAIHATDRGSRRGRIRLLNGLGGPNRRVGLPGHAVDGRAGSRARC